MDRRDQFTQPPRWSFRGQFVVRIAMAHYGNAPSTYSLVAKFECLPGIERIPFNSIADIVLGAVVRYSEVCPVIRFPKDGTDLVLFQMRSFLVVYSNELARSPLVGDRRILERFKHILFVRRITTRRPAAVFAARGTIGKCYQRLPFDTKCLAGLVRVRSHFGKEVDEFALL